MSDCTYVVRIDFSYDRYLITWSVWHYCWMIWRLNLSNWFWVIVTQINLKIWTETCTAIIFAMNLMFCKRLQILQKSEYQLKYMLAASFSLLIRSFLCYVKPIYRELPDKQSYLNWLKHKSKVGICLYYLISSLVELNFVQFNKVINFRSRLFYVKECKCIHMNLKTKNVCCLLIKRGKKDLIEYTSM